VSLHVYVSGANLLIPVSSYGWYHSFRSTVCGELEGGRWGSRFPRLQNHSDCDGSYSPEEAAGLLAELAVIRRELESIRYPVAFYCDGEGRVLGYRRKYCQAGTYALGNGFEFGVTEEGLVVQASDQDRVALPPDEEIVGISGHPEYRWYFSFMERLDEEVWKCHRRDGTSVTVENLPTCAPDECAVIRAGEMSALEVFADIIDALEQACRASIETGDPMVFC